MQPRTADVVIIGAGAIGCSIAYHLGLRGTKQVVVLEQEFVGSGTTSKAAGGIRVQFPTAVEIEFSIQSLEFFRHFQEALGVNPHLRQVGYLFLLGSAMDVGHYQRQITLQRQYGLDVRLLTPDDAKAIVPQLRVDDLLAAVYSPQDGYADPHTVVQAYAARAREHGVKILEQTGVTGIRLRGDRVVGVDTTSGAIDTRLVVNAAGPWAARVAEMVGMKVPVHPRRRHIFVTEPFSDFVNPSPLVIDRTSGFYCRTEGRSILMSPGDVQAVEGYKVTIDWSMAEETARKAVHRVPVLERAGIMSGWAGLRPLTPDEHAIIDYVPGVEGFLCAIGFCGHGFQHSPAAGKVVTEMILDGEPSIDISDLGFARFRESAPTWQPLGIPQPD
ncbi:MAG TPA: FAD-binding oxidoreductase [Alphaproteobacteria bacterium]|nr:FAD-binding oxidoreductase [Alphaproteobacteria bacterium]